MNDLHELLRDAVADVEPTDRLDDLRARTADPAHAAARPWFVAAGATVLVTAAAVTVFAVLDDGPTEPAHHHDHGTAMEPPAATELVPAYFLGETPQGVLLYREFDEVPAGDPLQGALDRIQQPAVDPDYTTGWEPGTLVAAAVVDGTIDVELAAGHHLRIDELAAQQVVYTLQGALGESLPVRFVQGDTVVLGPITAAPEADVLNPVSISDPAERNEYSGSFVARGRASSFEGTVPWQLRQGATVVREGFATATGAMGRLSPWEATVDLAGVAPGKYIFVALTDDPSDGEGPGPFADTRTISVR